MTDGGMGMSLVKHNGRPMFHPRSKEGASVKISFLLVCYLYSDSEEGRKGGRGMSFAREKITTTRR